MKTFSASVLSAVFTGIMIIAGVSCDRNEDHIFTSGSYSYKGYDIGKNKVTEGRIEITVEGSIIEGFRNIEIVGSNVGNVSDAGAGTINGQIVDGETIDITMMDGDGPYMIIRGTFKDGILKGQRFWGITGGAPETIIGTFESQRMK